MSNTTAQFLVSKGMAQPINDNFDDTSQEKLMINQPELSIVYIIDKLESQQAEINDLKQKYEYLEKLILSR